MHDSVDLATNFGRAHNGVSQLRGGVAGSETRGNGNLGLNFSVGKDFSRDDIGGCGGLTKLGEHGEHRGLSFSDSAGDCYPHGFNVPERAVLQQNGWVSEPSPFIVTRLEPEEWPLYKALRLESLQVNPEAFGSTYDSAVAHPDERWRGMLEAGRLSDTGFMLFARKGEEVLGMIGCFRPVADGPLQVVSYYVTPKARGQGLGRALLNRLIQDAAKVELRLAVRKGQSAAIAVYENAGFTVLRELENEFEMSRAPEGQTS